MNIKETSDDLPKRKDIFIVILLIAICSLFSATIPPFQSPDEFDHIKRAYLLSKGQFILETPEGKASGGAIDSGLMAYIGSYEMLPFHPDKKVTQNDRAAAEHIGWTGVREFSTAPGTGYYFPLIYAPQALGLFLGELFNLTLDSSYQIARFMALASSAILLAVSFRLYPVNPLVIAMLIIPMSVFQFSSASLDGISTALSIFAISIFLRLMNSKLNDQAWFFPLLTLSVSIIVTSRVHLLPLLTLPLIVSFFTKDRRHFLISAIATFAVFAWLIIAIKFTVDNRVTIGASTSHLVKFYLTNPLEFFNVLIATFNSHGLLRCYQKSFIGILGWLDTPLSNTLYGFVSNLIALIALFSISVKGINQNWIPRLSMLFGALTSILLVFFALLVTWNPHPATIVQGVQGRYFLVPVIMIAYALGGSVEPFKGVFRKASLPLILILGATTLYATPRVLIERYFLAPDQKVLPAAEMRASEPPGQQGPIEIWKGRVVSRDTAPNVDIKAAGRDERVTIAPGEPINIAISLDPKGYRGQSADWWVVAATPFGLFSYHHPLGWEAGLHLAAQFPLLSLDQLFTVLDANLPVGEYTFFFGIDNNADGIPDGTWLDAVTVLVSQRTNQSQKEGARGAVEDSPRPD